MIKEDLLCLLFVVDLACMSRAPYFKASGRQKVEGSLIRLFKAKEGSRSMRLLACINILRLANLIQLSLIGNSAARASA
jgi:hypothetical protein